MNSKIKILLIQITNKNYGDTVIADNTRYLLGKSFPVWKRDGYEILDYAINTEDIEQIKYVDAIVFAGGGLIKFRQENLYRQVSEIINEAQRYGIPVFMNSVGVEGYDDGDERCIMVRDAINQPCVKGISVRDNVGLLREKYLSSASASVHEVFDPAIFSGETYKDIISSEDRSEYIGLGVARANLYQDYGIEEIDEDYLLKFWEEVILKLEGLGIKWKIFTNGLDADEQFAHRLIEHIGHGVKVEQPVNAKELVKNINSFKALIACRMHSNIIAYALGVPSIGLVWNEKMTFWGKKINYPERFVEADMLKAEHVVACLLGAIKEGTKRPGYIKKFGTRKYLKQFIRKNVVKREALTEEIDYRKKLIATALGGCDFKYKNLNSISRISTSKNNGYRFLEVDVRLSKDEQLVCVNGWSAASYKALGVNDGLPEGLDREEFLRKKYYGYFETCDFNKMADEIKANEDVKFILDVGKPKAQNIDIFYEKLSATLKEHNIKPQNVMIRFQREKDIKIWRKCGYKCKMIYFISGVENAQDVISICKKYKISIVSTTEKIASEELVIKLHEEDLRCMIFSYTKAGDVIASIKCGADYVASHYYSVSYLERLTK